MHIETCPKRVVASAIISELQSSDMYLTLVARLFDLRANLNGVRVTEAFLDEIVENEAKYICHPLYADIRGLIANRTVGHMYNSRTGEFHSTQIGAFYRFEKEVDGDNAYLIGYARVPKRNKALCKALSNLFADNALKFSFEVMCGVYTTDEDGTMAIDADVQNYWEGEAVVTFPACETAVAKELVAECLGKGDENMLDENIINAENETLSNECDVIAETETEQTVEVAETETAESEVAETVYVRHEHTEIDDVNVYNPDSGEDVHQRVIVETTTSTPVTLAEDNSDEEEEKQDTDAVEEDEEEEEEKHQTAETVSGNTEPSSEVAENTSSSSAEFMTLISELRDSIASVQAELAEMKKLHIEAAAIQTAGEEAKTEVAEMTLSADSDILPVHPFMAEMSAPKGKYSLLEEDKTRSRSYSLLERA